MKTNLSNLMSIAAEEEKRFMEYNYQVKEHTHSTSTQELDGTITIIEDYKEDFEKEFEAFKKSQEKISKVKAILYEKNNSFKLPDGRTIQQAIVDNNTLRKMKSLYGYLITQKSNKRRITEVNNSYFECRTVNYDVETLKKEYNNLVKQIQDTDFEISKLNSIEFDADI